MTGNLQIFFSSPNPLRQAIEHLFRVEPVLAFERTLPNHGYSPAGALVGLHVPLIALHIALNLIFPESSPLASGPFKQMALVPVPEATIDQDQGMVFA